jgi:molecular chaperone DnaK (HSP70)
MSTFSSDTESESAYDGAVERTVRILDTSPDIIVAIDFGTTFSGIAYLPTVKFKEDSTLKGIADKIGEVRNWPNKTNAVVDQCPTDLTYDATNGTLKKWGTGLANTKTTDIQMRHFKLGLLKDVTNRYGTADHVLSGFLSNSDWVPTDPPGKMPVDLAAEYLKKVIKFFETSHLPGIFDEATGPEAKLGYVMTVPAIWGHAAKNLTLEASTKAGIDPNSLVFVTEPEAAALYCSAVSPCGLKDGDNFVVCDAGGGTVVRVCPFLVNTRTSFLTKSCRSTHSSLQNAPLGPGDYMEPSSLKRTSLACSE